MFLIGSYFLLIFLKIFHNRVMTYNTRKWNDDTTQKVKKKKDLFAHAGGK